ncbi:MAG: hypothetical protein PHF70_02965 [Opitutales bacterium]|nr:hypothetical protein [Opitutales bacterium]
MIRNAIREGLTAARRNALPAFFLIVAGCLLVGAYYRLEGVRMALERVVHLREKMGLIYPMLSTAFFGGLLPIIMRRFHLGIRETFAGAAFYLLFWSEKGIEIDLFYRLQDWMWGSDNTWRTLITKMCFDQFVYSVLIAAPTMTLAYLWKDAGFRVKGVKDALAAKSFIARILTVQLSGWAVWMPGVMIIYAFPQPLQLPLNNLILTLWVMLLVLLTKAKPDDAKLPDNPLVEPANQGIRPS